MGKPSAASNTIRDHKAEACAVFARRDQDCNCSCCSVLTVTGDNGRPIGKTICSPLYFNEENSACYANYFRLSTLDIEYLSNRIHLSTIEEIVEERFPAVGDIGIE